MIIKPALIVQQMHWFVRITLYNVPYFNTIAPHQIIANMIMEYLYQ